MKIIVSKKKLKELLHNEKNLGFVPTMGALHRGHVSLIKKCILENTRTIVTIFVNKPQFNKRADYNRYPRSVKKDIVTLKKLKINFLYLPIEEEIYPNGQSKNIKINPLSKKLCGKFRPGHFKAVVDVVNRFINIIKPKKIYFGEKDMQQLKIIDDFVRKNHKNTKVIGCKNCYLHIFISAWFILAISRFELFNFLYLFDIILSLKQIFIFKSLKIFRVLLLYVPVGKDALIGFILVIFSNVLKFFKNSFFCIL